MSRDAVPANDGGGLQALALGMAGLGDKATERLKKSLLLLSLTSLAGRTARSYWQQLNQKTSFTVTVAQGDLIYPEIHAWLLEQIPRHRQRALTVESERTNGNEPMSDSSGSKRKRSLTVMYDGTRSQTIDINGHRVQISLNRVSLSGADINVIRGDLPISMRDHIVFTTRAAEGRDAVMDFLTQVVERAEKQPPRLWMARSWGSFDSRGEVPLRTPSTIVLRAGQMEKLQADLKDFLEKEETYIRLGLPYHRGYLFHGPPGTGKSSVARALATSLGLDVYFIALSAVTNDSMLAELLGRIEPRSVLLLEDVDIAHGMRERNDEAKGVTMAGLLNGLDGMMTPHGLVTILTSNNVDVLDPALVRAGRVDWKERLDYLDQEQFRRLIKVFTGKDWGYALMIPEKLTPATVLEQIKRHLDNPDEAQKALATYLYDMKTKEEVSV